MTAQRLLDLQDLLHREVPLSRHMGVTVDSYDGDVLTLSAQLEPNVNIHGTAFGGSVYSLAALCGWSLLRLRLEDLSLRAEIVVGSARIEYLRPVRTRLIARASCEVHDFGAFADRIQANRRASIEVKVVLGSGNGMGRLDAAVFTGLFATVSAY